MCYLCTGAGQRHGPRRIAQHPEQSGPFASARRSRASRKRLRGYVLTGLLLFVKTILSVRHKAQPVSR